MMDWESGMKFMFAAFAVFVFVVFVIGIFIGWMIL